MWINILVAGTALAMIVFTFGVVVVYDRSQQRRDLYRSKLERECDDNERRDTARGLLFSRTTLRKISVEINQGLERINKKKEESEVSEVDDKLLLSLKKNKEQVSYLLEKYPATRNNDFYLQLMYLRVFGGIPLPYIEWTDIRALSGRLESVRRVRQKIQNEDHMYPPTDSDVIAAREKRAKAYRKTIKKV